MTMPNNLILVRHGQSEANVMQKASKKGDNRHYTGDTLLTPDRSWRLTSQGVEQAKIAGAWIAEQNVNFGRRMVSPYTRTRETAGHLGLVGAVGGPHWEENRSIRERSWGEIGTLPKNEFREKYQQNAIYNDIDKLYWTPPNGESIANVAENRVRNLLSTLHRENGGDDVLLVTHGEFMWATRLVLERWSDEEFIERDDDPAEMIHNCTVLHYTRINPYTGEQAGKLFWIRRAWPVMIDGEWSMNVEDWEEFGRNRFTNEELIAKAETQRRFFEPQSTNTN